jgi:hypothetical protein
VFRAGVVSKNPVLVVANKMFTAWDKIPRVSMIDGSLAGMVPKPPVLGYYNNHIKLAQPDYFQLK